MEKDSDKMEFSPDSSDYRDNGNGSNKKQTDEHMVTETNGSSDKPMEKEEDVVNKNESKQKSIVSPRDILMKLDVSKLIFNGLVMLVYFTDGSHSGCSVFSFSELITEFRAAPSLTIAVLTTKGEKNFIKAADGTIEDLYLFLHGTKEIIFTGFITAALVDCFIGHDCVRDTIVYRNFNFSKKITDIGTEVAAILFDSVTRASRIIFDARLCTAIEFHHVSTHLAPTEVTEHIEFALAEVKVDDVNGFLDAFEPNPDVAGNLTLLFDKVDDEILPDEPPKHIIGYYPSIEDSSISVKYRGSQTIFKDILPVTIFVKMGEDGESIGSTESDESVVIIEDSKVEEGVDTVNQKK